ncbi:MAG: M48 family metallopeptidase [Syntrophobacteraceae bacterium]
MDAIKGCGINPAFTIRESKKARRVLLKISRKSGLEVVIPVGFDRKRIPGILAEKNEWIQEASRRLNDEIASRPESPTLPESIHLRAVGKRFTVQYISWNKGTFQLAQSGDSTIEVRGDAAKTDVCRHLLNRWLKYQGQIHLLPRLAKLSAQTGFTYRKAQVREQKSRWGSCSSNDTISLNCKLLFLPPELVDYILIHELCHTVHRNHSEKFWALVEKIEPRYRALDREVNKASKDVPAWTR